MKQIMIMVVIAALSTGCSSSEDERKEERKEIVDSIHRPLDKAKGLEQDVLDNATEQRKQLDDL